MLDSGDEKTTCINAIETKYEYISISSVTEQLSHIFMKHFPNKEYGEDVHYCNLRG